jgi:putative ABC transport system permease protein
LILTGAAELGLAGIGVGSAAVFIAFAMVGSAVVGPVFGWVGRPLVAWQGLTARLAIRSAARSPGRTTLVIVALSIGIAMMTVITTFEASVRAATEDRAAGQLAGIDLLVESPVGVPRTVAARLSELDGIDAVTPVRLGVMTVLNSYDAAQARDAAGVDAATASSAVPPIGAAKFLTGVDLDAASRMIEVPGLSPPITHLDDGEVMVLAKTAERAGWRVGDDVEVWFATTGRATLRLAATFTGRFGVDAEYVANLATTSSNAPPEFSGDSVVWAKADDRASVPEVVAAARRELRALAPGASVTSVQEYLGQRMTGINSLINLLVVLVGVSVLVAWVGVANTVALALRERRTETTRLRAVGLTRSQFHRTVVIETLLIAVFGSALGVVTGWSMAAGFITSMGEEGLRPVVDPVSIGGIALLGALAAIATAAYQARRVSGPVLPAGR